MIELYEALIELAIISLINTEDNAMIDIEVERIEQLEELLNALHNK